MVIKKRNFSINLAEGLDTKTDKKHVLPGRVTRLENAIYKKHMQLDKRTGYDKKTNSDTAGTALGTGNGLAYFNDELLQYNSQKVYSYSPNVDRWADKGSAVSAIIESRQMVRKTTTQTQSDSAITGGVGVYAWVDSSGGVRASVFDENTGTPLLSDVSLDSSASRVRCLSFSGYLFVFYYKSGALYVRRINPLSPTAFDSAVTITSSVETTDSNYDVYSYDALRMMYAFNVMPVAEVTTITCVADVSDSLDGTTFILQDSSGSVGFWFDVDDSGTTIPAEASACDRAVEITTIVTDDTAATVGGKVRTAVGADSQFSTGGAGADCIATDAATGHRDDASASTSGFTLVATTQGVSPSINVGWLSVVPAVLTGSFTEVSIAEAGTNCLAIVRGPNQTFYIGYQNSTNGVRCTILNNGGTEIVAPFTVEALTATDCINMTGFKLADDTGVTFLYEKTAAATYNHSIRIATVLSGGTVSVAAADFMRSVGLYSKAFTFTDADSNEHSFVGVSHSSTLQSTYFVVRSDGLVVGKQQYTNAGGLTAYPILSNVNQDADIFSWSILKKDQIVSENATIFTPTGVAKTKIDFTNENIFNTRQLGNNLLIVGGILNMYDGQSVVEHGFNLYPENEAIAEASSGSLADGTYGVKTLYEWTDAFGQIHRSQPSVGTLVTTSGGSKKITVTVPSLRITAKNNIDRSAVSIVGYVTEKNGLTYYRYTSVSSPTFNDMTADTVALPDITDVSAVASNEILYTTGSVFPNYPAPACSVIEIFQNRIWLGGVEEKDQVWFSKEMKSGEPLEFTDTFNKSVEANRGKVTSFGRMEDKLLIMKRDKVYYLYGDGPNNTNTLGGFSDITETTVGIGTTNQKSVVRVPGGIMLKTEKGYYGINGSLESMYLGEAVEDYNDLTVSSATLIRDNDEVRFTTSDGDLLVYNYYFKKWSTFTNLKATDATLWGTVYTILKTDGSIFQQNNSKYKDDLSAYSMALETGWLAFAGVAGFKRVYRMYFVGEYKTPHQLRVSVGYDYSDSWEHSVVYNHETAVPIETYGQDSPYGETDTVYGGARNGYLFRIDMKIQKCTAIRFKIQELTTSATSGTQEGLKISDMGLIMGLKSGGSKLKASKTTGVS